MKSLSLEKPLSIPSLSALYGVLLSTTILLSISSAHAASPFTTEGKFSVGSDGSANYSIPIVVPPGTAGMQPQLALNYNSNGGNGIVGMGWGIDGLSQISRCPTTLEQDGVINGVNYTNTDRFCLDGQRLIATTDSYVTHPTDSTRKIYTTTSAYGANGTEYRTESANFAKIISYGQAGTGPAYFKVWTKSGQIIEYGNTVDSGIEAQGKPTIRTWGVNKISDTKGNYIAVTYTEDNANGEAYVQKIDYTGNAASTPTVTPYANLQFIYETRPDLTNAYQADSVTKSTKRLTNIKAYTNVGNVNTLVKDYRIAYDLSSATQRSRLKTLTECDGNVTNPICKQSVRGDWQEGGHGTFQYWTSSNVNLGAENNYAHYFVDVNGDGLVDTVQIARASNGGWIGINTGKGDFQYWTSSNVNLGAENNYAHYFVDVNGDGLVDTVQIARASNGGWIGINTGKGDFQYWTSSNVNLGAENNYAHYFVDVNGDGLVDTVQIARASNGGWIGINTGKGDFQYWTSSNVNLGAENNYAHYFVDVNGDGLVDTVQIARASNGGWIGINTGKGDFQYWTSSNVNLGAENNYAHYFVDVNGDGLVDTVQIARASNGGWIGINTGKGDFQYWTSSNVNLGAENNYAHYFVDVNGDGLVDTVQIARASNGGWIGINTGKGDFQYWTSSNVNLGAENNYAHYFVDVNGDGVLDTVQTSVTSNGGWIGINADLPPDLLFNMALGLDSSATVIYKPLTDGTVYTKDTTGISSSVYPDQDIQAPVYVVSSYSVSDGTGGFVTTNYQYGGLKTHLRGRGSLGFRYVKESSPDSGLSVTTFYRQDFPFIGLPSQVEKRRLSDNALLSVVQNTYANSDLATSTIISKFPYLSQSVEQAYELDSSLVSTTTTTNQYDDYGNVTSVKVDDGLGNIKTTTSTYSNNVGNWLLGRLIRSTVTSVTP